jgi:hypothetical protein
MYTSKHTGTQNTTYVNGLGAASTDSGGSLNAERITLGARGAGLSNFNNYEYYEVLIYDFAMGDEYRHAVEAYLGAKYALLNTQWAPPPLPPPTAPVGPYTPAGDPRVAFWVDAADPATLFQNAQGTNPTAANGQPIGLWKDKSQNHWDLTIEGGLDSNRPFYRTAQLNGKPSVRTEGSHWLRTRAASLTGSQYTFFIVCRRISATWLEALMSIHDENGTDWENNKTLVFGHVHHGHGDGVMSDVRNDILLSEHTHPGDGVSFIRTAVFNGTTNIAYLNGVAGASVPTSGTFNAQVITIGARNNIVYPYNNYDYFEVLIYDFAMDNAYKTAVETYLRNKYGL